MDWILLLIGIFVGFELRYFTDGYMNGGWSIVKSGDAFEDILSGRITRTGCCEESVVISIEKNDRTSKLRAWRYNGNQKKKIDIGFAISLIGKPE